MAAVRRETAVVAVLDKTMKQPKSKKPPIKIVVAFGPVTVEQFDALPERVKDEIGRLIHAFFVRLAAEKAERSAVVGIAA